MRRSPTRAAARAGGSAFHFTPHMSAPHICDAGDRGGVPLEIVSPAGHTPSVETTSGIYLHPTVEDLREALVAAGMSESLGDLL